MLINWTELNIQFVSCLISTSQYNFFNVGPSAVTNITIQSRTSSSLSFTWIPGSGYVDGYNCTVSNSSGSESKHTTTPLLQFDTGLTAGELYNFSVQSYSLASDGSAIYSDIRHTTARLCK